MKEEHKVVSKSIDLKSNNLKKKIESKFKGKLKNSVSEKKLVEKPVEKIEKVDDFMNKALKIMGQIIADNEDKEDFKKNAQKIQAIEEERKRKAEGNNII